MHDVWRLLVCVNAIYQVTHRLELTRHRLCQWNWVEVDDIFRRLEDVEALIIKLQLREDRG